MNLVPILFGGYFVSAIVASLYREWVDSSHQESEGTEWPLWAGSVGLEFMGQYPAYFVRGALEGVAISLRHEVEYGAKGARKYAVHISASLPAAAAGLSVIRPGMFARFFRAEPQQVGTASGELSVADAPDGAGRLSESTLGEGALSDPGGVIAERPSALTAVEVELDFAKRYDVTPLGAAIPPAVKRALLADSHLRIEEGVLRFSRNGVMRCAEAKTVVAMMVRVAKAFR